MRSALAARAGSRAVQRKPGAAAGAQQRTAGHTPTTDDRVNKVPTGGVHAEDNFVSADRVWRTGMLSVNEIQQALAAGRAGAENKKNTGGTAQQRRRPAAGRVPGAATGQAADAGAKPAKGKKAVQTEEASEATAVFSVGEVQNALNAQKAKKEGAGRTGRVTLADARDWRTATFSGAAVTAAAQRKQDRPNYNAFRKQRSARLGVLRLMGNWFYSLGFAAEYQVLRLWRVVRDGLIFVTQLMIWLFASVFGWMGGLLRGMARDLRAPFARFMRRRRQLARVRERATRRAMQGRPVNTFFGVGIGSSLRLIASVAGILMPLAATAVMCYVVYSVVNMNYVLAVELNGEVLGYVTDQSVVENAKGLLRDRIRLAKNQEVKDWQLTPQYTITWSDNFTTTQQLVNNILRSEANDGSDLVQATGVYLNDELYAVTTEGERLREYLDGLLERYHDPAFPDAKVDFVVPLECEPNDEDVYFASSVEDYDTLIEKLSSNVSEAVYYLAQGEQTLAEIALEQGISMEELLTRNPRLMGQAEDYVPETGERLLIERAKPFLQVQLSVRVESTEVMPYAVEETPTEDLAKNVRNVVQAGQDGLQQVWDDYIYVDGELVARNRVDEMTVVLVEPVAEIVSIGTYDFSDRPIGESTAAYIFPVPDSTWSSRGVSSYHRGLDINAPTGTPIFACQEGEVVTAGWHWSYGWHVVINHPDGYTTLYGHCSSLAVEAGQIVRQGDYIGAVGSTGVSTGPHTHLEVLLNGAWLDPLNFVSPPEGYIMRWRAG